MPDFKRQFVQERYPPIDISILNYVDIIKLRQGDNVIDINQNNLREFIGEMNEVREWSNSK